MFPTIRPRRLFVSGGSRLSANAATLWRELGCLLAHEDGLVVITGGFGGRADEPQVPTADRMVVTGMLRELQKLGVPAEERIETVLPDRRQDPKGFVRFKEGHVRVLNNRNGQARRFSVVHSADVVISVEGEHGTRSVLDVALAIERPILPLPFGAGASREVWREQRDEIVNWFQIPPDEAKAFEQTNLSKLTEPQLRELATRVHDCVMRGFTQGCFVIMRFHPDADPVFDDAIVPALEAHGFQPWRTDRTVATGDVVAAIRDGIDHCYFVIADTTEDRPNVMYELGLAHATGKPVILLRRANADGSLPAPPFDFQSQSILKYSGDMLDLRKRLEGAIAIISGKTRT